MCSAETPIKTDRVKEDKKVSLEEKSDLEEWDSLSTLALAAKVRELYGTNLTSDQILQFETVQDICDYLK